MHLHFLIICEVQIKHTGWQKVYFEGLKEQNFGPLLDLQKSVIKNQKWLFMRSDIVSCVVLTVEIGIAEV